MVGNYVYQNDDFEDNDNTDESGAAYIINAHITSKEDGAVNVLKNKLTFRVICDNADELKVDDYVRIEFDSEPKQLGTGLYQIKAKKVTVVPEEQNNN